MTTEPGQEQTGKAVKNQFKPVTEAELEMLAGVGSYGRGLKYFRGGHITDAVLRGDTLYAQCYGSQESAYTLSATLVRAEANAEANHNATETTTAAMGKQAAPVGGVQITAYDCECEAGGFCKHLVALLLAWLNAPETIEVREEFAVRLQALSHAQLLTLCVKLLQRQPDMEYLIDIVAPTVLPTSEQSEITTEEDAPPPIPVSPLANAQTVDVNAIRRKMQKLMRRAADDYDNYYGMASQLAEELEPLVSTGDEYAQAGQWANAQAVYETVALEAIEGYEELEDEGDLAGVLSECSAGLAQCLDAQATLPDAARLSPDGRRRLIESLYKLWEYDQSMGGLDLATDAQESIARNVTPDERALVETWLQSGRKQTTDFYSNFSNSQRARFHVALKVYSGISDEEKLAEYGRFGLYAEVTELLLQMGRIDEAMAAALKNTPEQAQLTAFADKLRALGGENVTRALDFIAQQQEKLDAETGLNSSVGYLRWLSERYAVDNQPDKALEAQLRLFYAAPNQSEYRNVRKAAQLPGNPADAWTRLRPDLIAILEERKAWRDLVEIYIEEAQARKALDTLALFAAATTYRQGGDLHARVANVAEADFPDESRLLYQSLAENLISQRGRDNYQLAASYLARAKELAGRANHLVEWNRYFADLRDANNRLPALKDELRARKLL